MRSSSRTRFDDREGSRSPVFVGRLSDYAAESPPGARTHSYAALAFYTDGSARMQQRAQWTVQAGDVFLVPAGEPHRRVDSRGVEAWLVGFCVPCLDRETFAPLIEPFELVRDGAAPVVPIPAARRVFLGSLFAELSATPPQERTATMSLLTLILLEVSRAAMPRGADAKPSVVAETLRYIERHCLGPLTLQQVARAMRRSPSYITSAVTKSTGRSAVGWIIAGRMAEARRRLLQSDETVETISERVGYADPTHFIRLFRREHGVTPAAWRKRERAPR